MSIKLPRYTTKDYVVLGIVLLPITLVINSVIFSSRYYSDWQIFFFATGVTAAGFCINFTICGWVAVLMKKRFPGEQQVGKRLTLMIISFILFTGLFLFSFFKGYELFPFLNYTFNEAGFIWAYIGMAIINIFLTFLHEGIGRYDSWKANLKETEALKKVYRQGRLQGLKSQINPHFLFNSLNSLSSLIHEDEEKSEKFLNEMSKVYRYMLQNDEEALVTLKTELKFLESYIYLLQARHGEALKLELDIAESAQEKLIPPLTLQAIIEDTVARNSVCRDCPLEIQLHATGVDECIIIRNNVMPKLASEVQEMDSPSGLDNLKSKYHLLNQKDVLISEQNHFRTIHLPLIMNKEEVML